MKLQVLLGAIVLSASFFSPAISVGSEALFVQKCGGCHKKGGGASPVNPADKAGVVWGKYFERSRHPVDLAATVSQAELDQVLTFLKEHAADSDHPAAAVIPK